MAHYSKEPVVVTGGVGGSGGGGGMRFLTGDGEPEATLGQPGDVYMNNVNGDMYSNKNGVWTLESNLKGAAGKDGAQGSKGDTGAQGPKGETGDKGADGSKGDVGANGSKGDKGDKGDRGDRGENGKDGFASEEDWNALVARVASLEQAEE